MKQFKWIGIAMSGLLVIGLVGGISAFSFFNSASAKSSNFVTVNAQAAPPTSGPGFPGPRGNNDQYLADALGITVEQLQTAQQQAYKDAIQEALDKGLITQAQADNLSQGRQFRGLDGFFLGPDSDIDMNALLANALGITTDKLQAAREQANKAMIEQQVTDGNLSQEQADLMIARQALGNYVDQQAILAKALGITTDQLETYRTDGKTMSEILAELDLTPQEVLEAELAAYEAAIQQAVTDNVITQAQANLILTSRINGLGYGQPGEMRGGMGRGGPGGDNRPFEQPNGGPNGDPQAPNAPSTTTPNGTNF